MNDTDRVFGGDIVQIGLGQMPFFMNQGIVITAAPDPLSGFGRTGRLLDASPDLVDAFIGRAAAIHKGQGVGEVGHVIVGFDQPGYNGPAGQVHDFAPRPAHWRTCLV